MHKNNRQSRIAIASETLEILKTGHYTNKSGNKVEIGAELNYAIENSILYKPDMFDEMQESIDNTIKHRQGSKVEIEVTAETTINAAKRLVLGENIEDVICLNFASAKNPGGGFLSGSQAQEESLARASGLYSCIAQMNEMYDYNRSQNNCFYSDYMIFSPKVPIFRDDNDKLIEKPYLASFITAPAVNAGVVLQREPGSIDRIHAVMIERIKKLLAVTALNNCKTVVLGAYGCGVFKNKSEHVAEYFRKVLIEDNYKVLFDKIMFAIYDKNANSIKVEIFKEKLGIRRNS